MILHALPDVAAQWGIGEQMKEPERWLTRQIASGKFRARRIGRRWMMTDDDLAYNLDQLANVADRPVADPEPAEHGVGVPSLASMRRRRSA